VVVATRSAHKLGELRELLDLARTQLLSLDDAGVPGEPIEDGLTFETNARIKARFAARATGLPAIADDSGIEVEALGGRPGVHTRRYAGPNASDDENNAKLLDELRNIPTSLRGARYVCVLALALPDPAAPGGLALLTRRGTSRGRIAFEPRGSGGFGYDPIFLPDGFGQTTAEMTAEAKDAISHRGRAFRALTPFICRLA
jgi:XTP/dITP diphosphohydrolase